MKNKNLTIHADNVVKSLEIRSKQGGGGFTPKQQKMLDSLISELQLSEKIS